MEPGPFFGAQHSAVVRLALSSATGLAVTAFGAYVAHEAARRYEQVERDHLDALNLHYRPRGHTRRATSIGPCEAP